MQGRGTSVAIDSKIDGVQNRRQGGAHPRVILVESFALNAIHVVHVWLALDTAHVGVTTNLLGVRLNGHHPCNKTVDSSILVCQ